MRRRRIFDIAVLFLTLCAGCQDANRIEQDTFNRANTAYKQSDYKGAIKLYQKIISDGVTSQPLHFNLGNAYMKDGQLGRAIAAYERALRLQPRDSDLAANLTFARHRMATPEPEGAKSLGRAMFPHINSITLDELVIILVVIGIGITILILGGLFSHWRFRKTSLFISLLAVLFVFHLFALFAKVDDLRDRAVVVSTSDVKYEPEDNATTHFTAYEGWKLRLLKESSGWVKVERSDGLQGWIPKSRVEPI